MATSPEAKKPKLTAPVLGTHSGHFHADEALAIFLLRLLPRFKGSPVVRTRDPAKLAQCDVVVDVGGTYEPEKERYDHHQRGFEEVFGLGRTVKLSSAGLVYKHFGAEILSTSLSLPIDDPSIAVLYKAVYIDFVEALDGIDNGVSLYSSSVLGGAQPAYRSRTDLSSRVGALNPRWNEASSDDILDAKFEVASALAGGEFVERVDYLAKAWLPAREGVKSALEGIKDRIVVFEDFLPWKEHLHNLEVELALPEEKKPLYVLYPDEAGKWRVQAVPVTADSFESRKALPEAWRGVRDEKLDALTGLQGCIFIHASGFIGGAQTKETALQLAQKALEL